MTSTLKMTWSSTPRAAHLQKKVYFGAFKTPFPQPQNKKITQLRLTRMTQHDHEIICFVTKVVSEWHAIKNTLH